MKRKIIFSLTIFSITLSICLTANQNWNVVKSHPISINAKPFSGEKNQQREIYSPSLGKLVPVVDKRTEFEEISRRTVYSNESKKVFLENRKHQIIINPRLKDEEKNRQLNEIDRLLLQIRLSSKTDNNQMFVSEANEASPSTLTTQQCYGTVAHGVVLEEAPRENFSWSSVFDGKVTIPQTRGGQTDSGYCLSERHIFVATNNQAVKNAEAYVSYSNETSDAQFVVFDWSIPNWALFLNYSNLGNYITTHTTSQRSYPVVLVHNATGQPAGINPSDWKNEVFLYNWNTGTYDLIYQRQYAATLQEQKGPTTTKPVAFVESRKNWNRNSSHLGFLGFWIGSGTENSSGRQWTWHNPDTSISHIRRDTYANPYDGMGFYEILAERVSNGQFIVQAGN